MADLKRVYVAPTEDTALNELELFYEADNDRFVCIRREYLEFQKLIYKQATQNYYRFYSRSRNNVKNVHIFPLVPQIWVQSGSMPVLIIHLFMEITRK